LSLPDAEVTTWDPEHREPHAVEQVIATTEGALVLGMELEPSWTVDGAEVLWTAHDTARRSFETACSQWARSKREWG